MAGFNRIEAESILTPQEKEILKNFKEGLEQDLDLAGIEGVERQKIFSALMNYKTCYLCEEHYRIKYNQKADTVEELINYPYRGNDRKKQEEYSNLYSKEYAILRNLERKYEEYHAAKIDMEDVAKKADVELDTRLAERGIGNEPAKAPKNGPTVNQPNNSKKR